MTTSQAGIKAIILYGSHARGDANSDSDVDICAFTHSTLHPTEAEVRLLAPSIPQGTVTLSVYCERDVVSMLEYGSLFLWHLKLEGRVLYGAEYVAKRLEQLRAFRRHRTEIAFYTTLLSDLERVSNPGWIANEFDLSLLFTIARNTCTILAHKAGVPVFGRVDCYITAARVFPDLPLDLVTYSDLSKWKSVYERGLNCREDLPSGDDMARLFILIRGLLEYADEQTS
jgi:predicted nucleotidyltransferase